MPYVSFSSVRKYVKNILNLHQKLTDNVAEKTNLQKFILLPIYTALGICEISMKLFSFLTLIFVFYFFVFPII